MIYLDISCPHSATRLRRSSLSHAAQNDHVLGSLGNLSRGPQLHLIQIYGLFKSYGPNYVKAHELSDLCCESRTSSKSIRLVWYLLLAVKTSVSPQKSSICIDKHL